MGHYTAEQKQQCRAAISDSDAQFIDQVLACMNYLATAGGPDYHIHGYQEVATQIALNAVRNSNSIYYANQTNLKLDALNKHLDEAVEALDAIARNGR